MSLILGCFCRNIDKTTIFYYSFYFIFIGCVLPDNRLWNDHDYKICVTDMKILFLIFYLNKKDKAKSVAEMRTRLSTKID